MSADPTSHPTNLHNRADQLPGIQRPKILQSTYGEAITVKTGAEGVYSAAFHELGLGAMVKARDGNKRGAEVAIGTVIRALGYPIEESVKGFFQPKLLNWAGDEVGDITTPDFLCYDADIR